MQQGRIGVRHEVHEIVIFIRICSDFIADHYMFWYVLMPGGSWKGRHFHFEERGTCKHSLFVLLYVFRLHGWLRLCGLDMATCIFYWNE